MRVSIPPRSGSGLFASTVKELLPYPVINDSVIDRIADHKQVDEKHQSKKNINGGKQNGRDSRYHNPEHPPDLVPKPVDLVSISYHAMR